MQLSLSTGILKSDSAQATEYSDKDHGVLAVCAGSYAGPPAGFGLLRRSKHSAVA